MAFRLVGTLLAEGVSLDRFTGRLSAFNMIDVVFAPSFPAILGKLVVVNLYEIDGAREPYWERVTISDEDGAVLGQAIAELTGDGEAHNSMGLYQGLKLAKPSVHRVTVEGAPKREGPWQQVSSRRFRAALGPHPLTRRDVKDLSAGKIKGPASITD